VLSEDALPVGMIRIALAAASQRVFLGPPEGCRDTDWLSSDGLKFHEACQTFRERTLNGQEIFSRFFATFDH